MVGTVLVWTKNDVEQGERVRGGKVMRLRRGAAKKQEGTTLHSWGDRVCIHTAHTDIHTHTHTLMHTHTHTHINTVLLAGMSL